MLTPLGRSLASLTAALALACSAVAVGAPAYADPAVPAPPAGGGGGEGAAGSIVEISLPLKGGSTHELAFAPGGSAVWVTQQNQAALVRIAIPSLQVATFPLIPGSGPHGIKFDAAGDLWITLEFSNLIVRLAVDGPQGPGPRVLQVYPIPMPGAGPHGLDIGPDGRTVWWAPVSAAPSHP